MDVDVVILGAGSAGERLAALLAGRRRVAVVEDGARRRRLPVRRLPAQQGAARLGPRPPPPRARPRPRRRRR